MWKYSVSIGQINVNNKQRQINVVCTTAWSKNIILKLMTC